MSNPGKILFLNPPLSAAQRYGMLSSAGAVEPPLGLAYLAAVTRKLGLTTTILDAQALGLEIETSVTQILDDNPDFLAITVPSAALSAAAALAGMVKKANPLITVIVGGNHLSALAQKTLQENPCFDVGIIGEGERTLEKLLAVLRVKGDLSSVAGVAFRSGNAIVMSPVCTRIDLLDDLPMPAFDLLPDIGRYYRPAAQSLMYLPSISLVTSRGCPGKCLFCDRKTFGHTIRMHGAEYVADMMEKLYRDFGVRGVVFEDDNFMLSQERLEHLARLIIKRKIRVAWSALSRVDTINRDKIRIAKSCGCWKILYGIESGSQKILDFYQKGITLSQIQKAVQLTKNNGLFSKGFIILGNPLESRQTLQETKRLVMGLPLDDISITYFTPYPGSEIWDQVARYGQFDTMNWDSLTCFDPVFIPHGLSKNEICDFQTEIYRAFYSRPSVIFSYVRRLRSLPQITALYKSYRSFNEHLKIHPDAATNN